MITHKFVDGGHTQNEDDSIHCTIESAVKKVSVHTRTVVFHCEDSQVHSALPSQGIASYTLPGFQRTQQMPDRF